jgi:hypothetical protein
MVSTRSLSVFVLALASAEGAAAIANNNLAGLQGRALSAWEVASAVAAIKNNKPTLRRGRDLQTFADSCAYLENSFEQGGFTCECGTSTLTCQLPSTCESNGACANVDMTMTFSDELAVETVDICIKYTSDPTGDYQDACVSMTYGSDMSSVESCSVQIEDASGALATCNTCEPCDGMGAAVNVDCSNIIPGATTGGCSATGMSGGGSQELFGDLNGNGSDGGVTSGGGDSGSDSGSGSGNGNANGGAGSPVSTSSGVFQGSNILLALGGFAMALII